MKKLEELNLNEAEILDRSAFMAYSYDNGSGTSGSSGSSGSSEDIDLVTCRIKGCGALYPDVLDACPVCGKSKVFVKDTITPCLKKKWRDPCEVFYEYEDGTFKMLNPGFCSKFIDSPLFCYEGLYPIS